MEGMKGMTGILQMYTCQPYCIPTVYTLQPATSVGNSVIYDGG